MKTRRHKRSRNAMGRREPYVFRLFVAGHESNSTQARVNLTRLCEEHLKGRHQIKVVDVLQDAAVAYKNNVLLTPTLILIKPRPKVTVLGNLGETRQVLAALRLMGDE
jgi:circadian clock protein KaiB